MTPACCESPIELHVYIALLAGVFTCCICLLLLVLAQIVTLQRACESAFEVFCAQRDVNTYLSTYVYIMHNITLILFLFFFQVLFWDCSTPPFGAIAWDSSLWFLYYYMQENCNCDSHFAWDSSLWSTCLYISQRLWLRFGALLCQVDGLLTKSIGFLDQKVVWGDIPVREVMHTVYPHHLQAEMVL